METIKYSLYRIQRFFEKAESNVACNLFEAIRSIKKEKNDIATKVSTIVLLLANVVAFVGPCVLE